ncbi:protein of unknown function [Candidatus Filomicrobium marinum]|uniref:Uncharacterized protein n=1 Tax=Candidatus Filomicrobium marinum TaxID=1608628 RepID=A0A0D6JGQ6_9HYPH|nr:protein of unknown function [Candidatus Filomicrobium marinum]CPR19672.1 protein of unknown function [Candidatus Filomicrobium marinum]
MPPALANYVILQFSRISRSGIQASLQTLHCEFEGGIKRLVNPALPAHSVSALPQDPLDEVVLQPYLAIRSQSARGGT